MKKISLRFNAGVRYKEKIFASAIYINGLFQLDLATSEITYIKSFSKESPSYAMHRTAFLYKNEAWFIPQNGRYIAIVNLDTLEIEYLEPPYQKINKKATLRINAVYYSGGIIADRYLYLIPTNIDTLLLIDMENKVLYPYYNITRKDEYFLFGAFANESIYLCPYSGNSLIKLNLKTNKRERYTWKYSVGEFLEVACFKNKLYFCPGNSKFILIKDLNSEIEEKIYLNEFYNSKHTYEQIQVYKDKLFFIPFQGNKILELGIPDHQLKTYELPENLLENGSNGFTKLYSEEQMILASYQKGSILIFSEEKDEFQKIDLRIDRDVLIDELENKNDTADKNFRHFVYEGLYVVNGCYQEKFWGVDEYIKMDSRVIPPVNLNKKCGEKIWRISKQ